MKVGDLIEYDDGSLGLITSEPYNTFNGQVTVVNVLWQGREEPSKMDIAAIRSGTVRLISESR